MSQIKEFATMLVIASVGCCAFKMLLPESAMLPVLRTVLSVFFLLCILTPLRGISLKLPDAPALQSERTPGSERLQDTYRQQLEASVQKNVTKVLEVRLEHMGIDVQGTNIMINVHADEDGSIDISGVELILTQQDASRAQEAQRCVEEELSLPCKVSVMGEVENDGA